MLLCRLLGPLHFQARKDTDYLLSLSWGKFSIELGRIPVEYVQNTQSSGIQNLLKVNFAGPAKRVVDHIFDKRFRSMQIIKELPLFIEYFLRKCFVVGPTSLSD